MHANVREDARRKDRLDDIKRGPGGIREIEFLAQCFQILRGSNPFTRPGVGGDRILAAAKRWLKCARTTFTCAGWKTGYKPFATSRFIVYRPARPEAPGILINIAAQDREAHVRYCSYFADNVLDRLDDIKRGPGGIREIEFLAQCFQILRGGREPDLQTPSLDRALEEIAVPALMSSEAVVEVRQDYVYLRRLEKVA